MCFHIFWNMYKSQTLVMPCHTPEAMYETNNCRTWRNRWFFPCPLAIREDQEWESWWKKLTCQAEFQLLYGLIYLAQPSGDPNIPCNLFFPVRTAICQHVHVITYHVIDTRDVTISYMTNTLRHASTIQKQSSALKINKWFSQNQKKFINQKRLIKTHLGCRYDNVTYLFYTT